MARRRRRNPGGVVEWAKLHPWMTFFIAGGVLTTVQVMVTAAAARAAAPPADPLSKPTPAPVPAPVPPALGGGTVFVPPQCPPGQRVFVGANGVASCIEVQT